MRTGIGQSSPRIPTILRLHTDKGMAAEAEKKIRFREKLSDYEPSDSGKGDIEFPLEWKRLPDILQGLACKNRGYKDKSHGSRCNEDSISNAERSWAVYLSRRVLGHAGCVSCLPRV